MKRVLLVVGLVVLMSGCQSSPEENQLTIPQNTPLVSPAPVISKKPLTPKAPIKPKFVTLEEREKKYINEARDDG